MKKKTNKELETKEKCSRCKKAVTWAFSKIEYICGACGNVDKWKTPQITT